tara:strand:- start:272 stop:424 length:153 start_codon:yes stop_codon:yes gene_type:complete
MIGLNYSIGLYPRTDQNLFAQQKTASMALKSPKKTIVCKQTSSIEQNESR